MIVAVQKPLQEIAQMIGESRKALFVGCGGCATVCLAGGERETMMLAAALRVKRRQQKKPLETAVYVCPRQCAPEFLTPLDSLAKDAEVIVSLACGVGVQYLAARYPDKWVVPALDTLFAGGSGEQGVWEERCALCGDCLLHLTGGICPLTRCAKSLLNGPCGGSQGGKCELDKDINCAWQLIYDRMEALGRLDLLKEIRIPRDWRTSRHGGPRKSCREDLL